MSELPQDMRAVGRALPDISVMVRNPHPTKHETIEALFEAVNTRQLLSELTECMAIATRYTRPSGRSKDRSGKASEDYLAISEANSH